MRLIISCPPPALDLRPITWAVARMHPELGALILPGEGWDDMMARRAAAADILDDLLYEFDAETADDLAGVA